MRDADPRDADPIERQVLQVRRRRNLRELQRVLFALVALAAASGAALVMLALLAEPKLFAVATWGAAGTVVVTAILLLRTLRRRWLAADAAAAWIDARAALGGRLATLVAVRDRARGDIPFFLPLLAEQNRRAMERWRPDRLIRRRTPLAALASALVATTALLLALIVAPRLRPPLPQIVYSDRPVDGTDLGPPNGVPERIVVAPPHEGGGPSERHERGPGAGANGGDDGERDDSAMARLSSALQDRIRRDLWGREWQAAHDAMERAARDEQRRAQHASRDGDADGDDGEAGDGEQPWETAGLPADGRAPRGAAGDDARRGKPGESSDADAKARGLGDDAYDPQVGSGAGQPVPGAGNETDPNLFGAPTAVDGTRESGSSFELAINAPVRAQRNAPKRAGGDPPPASEDTHPALTRAGRQEHAIRRMPVPSGYETIVREMFAHRDATHETP